ncbi:Ycf51 family protein [Fischerella sp. PCC 9605]|uniref:Ycf51 family protein n=1 Tax=Fischerella sp. PCC 9605 TaxID=1173024 RepID=UPI000479A692|nr:Ycf51 family protein [Fischerella sp. PCC 9605]
MFSQADFIQYAQWSGIATLVFAALTVLGFILKWGLRFRLVGTTGFMLVLTAGLFALSLAPLTRTVIPGAVRYKLVYDNGATQTVIAISPEITPTELEATLRQAASDLYSYGRMGKPGQNQLTIRARTILHPEPGISVPFYLGQVKRSLVNREDPQMAIEIYHDRFAQLPKPNA